VEASIKQTEEILLNAGMELYTNNAPYGEIITHFDNASREYPRSATALTCLSWLYLMRNEKGDADRAIDAARRAQRLEANNVQAIFNQILGMLIAGKVGIRDVVEQAFAYATLEDITLAKDNLQDALTRRPDFAEAKKLLNWIESR